MTASIQIPTMEAHSSPFMSQTNTQTHNQRTNLEYTDHGEASSNTHIDLQRVLHLITQERHLIAYALYQTTLSRMDTNTNNTNKANANANHPQAAQFLSEHQEEFNTLERHAAIFLQAKNNASNQDPSRPWIICHVHPEQCITSSYRREQDGSLSLKVEGDVNGLPLFEQVGVMREVDLYHLWAPFVSKSKKLASLGKLDQVGWFQVSPPMTLGLVRDTCYRAIGCDCMMESGEVIVVAQGLDDDDEERDVFLQEENYRINNQRGGEHDDDNDDDDMDDDEWEEEIDSLNEMMGGVMDEVMDEMIQNYSDDDDEQDLSSTTNDCRKLNHSVSDSDASSLNGEYVNHLLAREAVMDTIAIPPRPKGARQNRMKLNFFQAVIKIKSPTSANTLLVANLDPKIKFLPQFVIEFIMKHMCGILLIRMQNAARRALKNYDDPLAIKMRNDVFYKSWLLPKFESYAKEMGWELPGVNAFLAKVENENDISRHRPRAIVFDPSVAGTPVQGGNSSAAGTSVGNTTKSSKRRRLKLKFSKRKPRNIRMQYSNESDETPCSPISNGSDASGVKSRFSDDASGLTRRSAFERLNIVKMMKLKRSRGDSNDSLSEVGSTTSRKVQFQFTPARAKRLEALKRFKNELGDEPLAMKSRGAIMYRSVVKEEENGIIAHILTDVSHLIVLPSMFAAMIFGMHGINASGHILEDHNKIRKVMTMLIFVTMYTCVHWAVIKTILVSSFDAIDLPLIKFTSDHKSSSTRRYAISQINQYTPIFSGGLGMLGIFIGFFRTMMLALRSLISFGEDDKVSASGFTICTICHEIVENSKTLMTYTAVFLSLCCLFAITYFSTPLSPAKSTVASPVASPVTSENENDNIPINIPTIESINTPAATDILLTIPESSIGTVHSTPGR